MVASGGKSGLSNALGTVGGVLLSICLMPQLYRIYKTRSTTDISLYYTLTYAAGLAFNLAYLVLEGALVGWIFVTIELALAVAVIVAKGWLERGGRGRRDAEAKQRCAEELERERQREKEEAKKRKEALGGGGAAGGADDGPKASARV